MSDLDIQPLTPERFGDLAALFEEGGDPKWCWCTYFRVRGRDWSNSTAESNRAELESRAGDDPPAGLLAYDGDRVVGWVSLGPRTTYERLEASRVLAPVDERPAWSIVCFVVSRSARGRGVARAMLDAAIRHAKAHGATLLEAYPVDTAGERVPAANAYRGTLRMFEAAGFTEVARRRANASSPERPIVRLEIRPADLRHPSRQGDRRPPG
jgi:ribosomal protein S18 acetylase RimI-like enzyme